MPLSSDPEARKRQLANLRPDAAVKHGAASERLVRERRTELVAELVAEYPNESKRVLTAQAHRLAVAEAGMAHADIYGIVKSKRTGETFPVAILTEKAIAAYLAEEARIEERQHRRAAEVDDSLEGIIAELAGGKDDRDE